MDGKGTLIVQVYTGIAQLPIKNAVVTVTSKAEENTNLTSLRYTDSSGRTPQIELSSPPFSNSLTPDNNLPAFASYDVRIDHPEFETALVNDVQLFSERITLLPVEMIPLAENEKSGEKIDITNITNQNL